VPKPANPESVKSANHERQPSSHKCILTIRCGTIVLHNTSSLLQSCRFLHAVRLDRSGGGREMETRRARAATSTTCKMDLLHCTPVQWSQARKLDCDLVGVRDGMARTTTAASSTNSQRMYALDENRTQSCDWCALSQAPWRLLSRRMT
jgi:hypothetical protein